MKNKFYITTPIYYASGEPHIGHAFTALYADILARYQKSLDKEVFFSVGMDEHGSKIAEKAESGGKAPQEFVDEISENFKNTWSSLNIQYSDFIRTTSQRHQKAVFEFIKKLHEAGDIYEGIYEGLYCVECENFITEKNLVNGLCSDHLKPPQKIKEKNYFFNLKKYLAEIKKRIENNELRITPESRKNESLGFIRAGISDFSITREKEKVKWGIEFPYDNTQTIYVWVEALANYFSVLDFPKGENFKKFWPADAHIIGADINKFHSVFWPGLLLSANLPLPKNIFVHGLFTVNGQKMGKALGNVIDPLDLIKKFGADATRYLLLSQFSALEHGDIKESEFLVKYNADLANGIGNLFERVFTLIKNNDINLETKFPSGNLVSLIKEIEEKYHSSMENYQLFEALREVFMFAKKLDKYIDDKKPWVMAKEGGGELEIVLNSLFSGIEKIIDWLEPFMPRKMAETKKYAEKIKSGTAEKEERLNLFPRIR